MAGETTILPLHDAVDAFVADVTDALETATGDGHEPLERIATDEVLSLVAAMVIADGRRSAVEVTAVRGLATHLAAGVPVVDAPGPGDGADAGWLERDSEVFTVLTGHDAAAGTAGTAGTVTYFSRALDVLPTSGSGPVHELLTV